ncbi:MAG: hypothetical protein IKG70_08850 [Lachnospiraceae bacterium]|nr:hypothetical protein [Lachnospiraceae bacterium]
MDEQRIWKMCRLALFEQEEGKKELTIASYYRRDYVGLGLLSNFVQVTVVYLLILAAVVIMKLDYLMNNFDKLDYVTIAAAMIAGYLLLIGLYSVLVFTLRRLKYLRARKKVRDYYIKLNELYEERTGDALHRQQASSEV